MWGGGSRPFLRGREILWRVGRVKPWIAVRFFYSCVLESENGGPIRLLGLSGESRLQM